MQAGNADIHPEILAVFTGKNRPLDEDDMAFVTSLQDSEYAKEESLRNAEREEVATFQEVSPWLTPTCTSK